jgi:hypothetical protein
MTDDQKAAVLISTLEPLFRPVLNMGREGMKMEVANLIRFEQTIAKPLGEGRTILQSEFKQGCFIYHSFGFERNENFGDMMIHAHMTFLADGGNGFAAEWEPQYGPIHVWSECAEDFVDLSNPVQPMPAKKHWHFDFVKDEPMNWSQLAVDRERLKENLIAGRIDDVFRSLLSWARSQE